MFTATVVGDPSNLGVTWTLTCVSDAENPPDCAWKHDDGDPDVSTLSNISDFSVISMLHRVRLVAACAMKTSPIAF